MFITNRKACAEQYPYTAHENAVLPSEFVSRIGSQKRTG